MTPQDPLMSFEAKIALALRGSNWQQLQHQDQFAATENDVQKHEGIDAEALEDGSANPPELTKKQKKKMARFDKAISRDAGDVLQIIEMDSISPVPWDVVWDQDPELLCCYNWQASTDGTNTIFVPGEPAKWHEPTLPHTLQPDSGFQYADYNYARQPKDPYSPMFHALNVMNPGYQFNDIDVLADRNNLRVLLEFCQGKANGPFRLNLYLLFNTLIIVRKETRWWKHSDGISYGCNFEKFFTQPTKDMEDATSHYRAIRYSMGPLNVVVRFEADAYDNGITSDFLTESEVAAVSGNLAERPTFDFRAPIRVLQKGHLVPTAQMVELKTQKYDPRGTSLVQCQDQLWFGRTSLLYTGPYEGGTGIVKRVKKEDATERVKKWEHNNQESLRKLVALLTELRAVLKREKRPNRAVVLVREHKDGPLSVRSMEGVSFAVSRDVFLKHWRPMPPHPSLRNETPRGNRRARGPFTGTRGRGHPHTPGTSNQRQSDVTGNSSQPHDHRSRGSYANSRGGRGRGGTQA